MPSQKIFLNSEVVAVKNLREDGMEVKLKDGKKLKAGALKTFNTLILNIFRAY